MVGVIIGLKHCQPWIENLYKLVLIMKNWSDDLRFECANGPKSFGKFLNYEDMWFLKMKSLIVDFNLFEEN
jgi:hypothetical protein